MRNGKHNSSLGLENAAGCTLNVERGTWNVERGEKARCEELTELSFTRTCAFIYYWGDGIRQAGGCQGGWGGGGKCGNHNGHNGHEGRA